MLDTKCTDANRTATRYGIVVISKSGTTLETGAAFRMLRRHARKFYEQHPEVHRQLVVAVTGENGRLFQLLMFATVVEGFLSNVNPFGQPGVEAYKENMNAILRGAAS